MNAFKAWQLWLLGRMTIDEVMAATGHTTTLGLMKEFVGMQDDYLASTERQDADVIEAEELEAEAYERWGDLLREEPGWLGQLKEVVRRKRHEHFMKVADAFNACRRSSSSNVVEFTSRG